MEMLRVNSADSDEKHVGGVDISIDPNLHINHFDLLGVHHITAGNRYLKVRKKDTHCVYTMLVVRPSQRNTSMEKLLSGKSHIHAKLANIDCDFVASLRFSFRTDDKLYLVFDHYDGSELFYQLKRKGKFTEDQARFYAAELVTVLEQLHQRGVIFGNLRPENVLLRSDGHIAVTENLFKVTQIDHSQLTQSFNSNAEYLGNVCLMDCTARPSLCDLC
jgi:serine/threonine protein kinase